MKDGRVVKGINFVNLRDAGDPVEAAIAYDAAGADELTFLDITASHENRGIMLDVVRRTAEACFMPVTVGGGVRTTEDIRGLLRAGADKVSINTAAVTNRQFVKDAAEKFGDQCIVVAIDAKKVSGPDEPALLGDLHPRRPHADRHRRHIAYAPRGGRARRRRDPCSPRWTATAPARASTSRSLCAIADAVTVPVDRVGRRRQILDHHGRRHPRRPPQPRCSPASIFAISASTRCGEGKQHMAKPPACRCGSIP